MVVGTLVVATFAKFRDQARQVLADKQTGRQPEEERAKRIAEITVPLSALVEEVD